MVLSETDAVLSGKTTEVGKVMDETKEGVTGAIDGVTAGCAGGESEHPQMNMNGRARRRRSGTGFIDAGQSFPYNKVMERQIGRSSFYACIKMFFKRGLAGEEINA
jgi:hypothetical protein